MDYTAVLNNESIVFIVEDQTVRRMLKMFLAAIDLDARVYPCQEEFMALHDSSRICYLVLDTQWAGMNGLIIKQLKNTDESNSTDNPAKFQLIPVKDQQSPELSLFTNSCINAVITDRTEGTLYNVREWR